MKRSSPLFYIVMVLCLSTLLCGCGIKPQNLSAPPGAEGQQYPRTYPDTATDPRP